MNDWTGRDIRDSIASLMERKVPQPLHIDADSVERLENSDCLSLKADVFRNGGTIDDKKAIPFVRLTPELLKFLQVIYQ